jgi:hypothetical protein
MRIEIKTYDTSITVEKTNDDLTTKDYFEIFIGLLIQIGFHEDSINEEIKELADERYSKMPR